MDIVSAIRKLEDIKDEVKEIDKWYDNERMNGNLKWDVVIKAIEDISQKKWDEAWELMCKIDQATKGIELEECSNNGENQ